MDVLVPQSVATGNPRNRVLSILLPVWLCLSGCSAVSLPKASGPEIRFTLSEGDVSRVDLALEETIDRFTGSGASGGGLVGEIPQDVLDRNTGTIPFRTVSARNARLSLVWGSDHGGLTFSRILSLSRSESRYALPAGAGILTDPIRIGFDTHALDVETRASWRPWRGRAYGPALMLGAGGAIMWTTTDIKSALLDVRQETTHPEWFISAGVYQPLILLPRVSPHAQIGLMARGVVYDSETAGYTFGIQSSF